MKMFLGGALATVLVASTAIAADDTCSSSGGTADCVGPEVGPYTYRVGDPATVGLGASQTEATAAYKAAVSAGYASINAPLCTLDVADNAPPWQPDPIGHGHTQQGTGGGVGIPFWSQDWTLSRETQSQKMPLVVTGTHTSYYDSQPCQRQIGPVAASITRNRTVVCPAGYSGNWSGVSSSYCYRLPNGRDPAKVQGGQCPKIGNPVHPSTGNKFQADDDYVGTGAMPLRFTRSYNSRMLANIAFQSRLGLSWRTTYDRFIQFSDGPISPTVYAYRADGQTLHFKFVSGKFQPDADIADRLVRLTDGWGNPTGWAYTVASTEETETYDAAGKLIQIKSRAGSTHSLSYDTNARLVAVADSFGKTLAFAYNSNGQIASLTSPDGQTYNYSYNAAGNVSSVLYPDGSTRTYLYNESANTNGANRPYALTGIVDESSSRFSTYKYDQYGRVFSTEHASGVDKYTLSYNGTDSWNTATTVTDPLLQQRVYAFVTTLGVDRNTSLSQPCTSGCGGSAAAHPDVCGRPVRL